MLQQGTRVISEFLKYQFLQLQKRDSDIETLNHKDQAYVFSVQDVEAHLQYACEQKPTRRITEQQQTKQKKLLKS